MFSSFPSNPPTESTSKSRLPPLRPKRTQVARACQWCKTNRTKCDAELPCQNCRQRGIECKSSDRASNNKVGGPREEQKEIERLSDRVKRLETQLLQERQDKERGSEKESGTDDAGENAPSSSDAMVVDGGTSLDGSTESGRDGPRESVPAGMARSHSSLDQHHRTGPDLMLDDPLSMAGLTRRMQQWLDRACPMSTPVLPALISQIDQVSKSASSSQNAVLLLNQRTLNSYQVLSGGIDFTRAHEENLLSLVWQYFYPIYPILSENDFRTYYESLWAHSDGTDARQPSALVDSLLALCIQYSSTFLANTTDCSENLPSCISDNPGIDYLFYLRAQALLIGEVESSTLPTLQSCVFCIVYLYHGSLLTTAHGLLGMASRLARKLRLHRQEKENSDSSPDSQSLRTRIRYTLSQLDLTISMALGADLSKNTEARAQDVPLKNNNETSAGALLKSSAHPDVSYLCFSIHHARLIATFAQIHTSVWAKAKELLEDANLQDLYENLEVVESLASFLEDETRPIEHWVQEVPKSLKLQRQGGSESLSTDRSPIILDASCPVWLQRQRLLLELIYHDQQISLLRPFIRFNPKASYIFPLSDRNMIGCLGHAMTMVSIIHKAAVETDFLRGWLPTLQYHYNALICILSFVATNPICPYTQAAQKSVKTAIQVLEAMGAYSSISCTAAKTAQNVADIIKEQSSKLTGRDCRTSTRSSSIMHTPASTDPNQTSPTTSEFNNLNLITSGSFQPFTQLSPMLSWHNQSFPQDQNVFNGSWQMPVSFDNMISLVSDDSSMWLAGVRAGTQAGLEPMVDE